MTAKAKLLKDISRIRKSTEWTVLDHEKSSREKSSRRAVNVLVYGPPNTPYEGGTFLVRMSTGPQYPIQAPDVKMKTTIFHPSINKHGKICLPALDNWDKNCSIEDCLKSIVQLMETPDLAEFISEEAMALFVDDKKEFERVAREYVRKFAMSKVNISYDIEWNKGVCMKFPELGEKYKFWMKFDDDVKERLNKCDYLAFIEFFSKFDKFIGDTIDTIRHSLSIAPNINDLIVQLSRGKQYPYGKKNQKHNQGNDNKENKDDNNQQNNNQNNQNNNNNNHNNNKDNDNNNNNNGNNNNQGGGGGGGGDNGGDTEDENDDDDAEDDDNGSDDNDENKDDNEDENEDENESDNEVIFDFDQDEKQGQLIDQSSVSTPGTQSQLYMNNTPSSINTQLSQPPLLQPSQISLPPIVHPKPLRDIMMCRGICNCSGDCGNTLIRASMLFYNSLINGNLDPDYFNSKVDANINEDQMWKRLLDVFEKAHNQDENENKNENKNDNMNDSVDVDVKVNDTGDRNKNEDENENKMKDGESEIESLIDVMCLIELMIETLPNSHYLNPFTKERWPENTFYSRVEKYMKRRNESNRKERINKWAIIMFEEFRKHFKRHQNNANNNNNNNNNNNEEDEKHNVLNNSQNNNEDSDEYGEYVLNQVFRAICVHNYGMVDAHNAYFGMQDMSFDTNVEFNIGGYVVNQEINVKVLKEFVQATQKTFGAQMIIDIASVGGKQADFAEFSILRLLILTMKFLIECETTFDLHIKCIDSNNDYVYTSKSLIQSKKFSQHEELQHIEKHCKRCFNNRERNLDIILKETNKKEKLLTMKMIKAISLYTFDPVCSDMKDYHIEGKTCKYRGICTLILQALRRLKEYDTKFNIKTCKDLYCGLANVTFNQDEFQTAVYPLLQRHGTIRRDSGNGVSGGRSSVVSGSIYSPFPSSNPLEYCIPWHSFTSTTPDINVAKKFSEFPVSPSRLKSAVSGSVKGIVFKVLKETLGGTKQVLYGDISWISVHPRELEVLFGPCLLQPFLNKNGNENGSSDPKLALNKTTQLIKVLPKPVQHVRQLLKYNSYNSYGLRSNSQIYSARSGSGSGSGSSNRNASIGFGSNTTTGSEMNSALRDFPMIDGDIDDQDDVKQTDPNVIELKKWINDLFPGNKNLQKRKEIFEYFRKSDTNTVKLIYDKITYKKLTDKNVTGIETKEDRNIVVGDIYKYYVGRNGFAEKDEFRYQRQVHQSLQKVLMDSNQEDKGLILEQYFVALMNECDKCDRETLQAIKENELSGLGIATHSLGLRKRLAQAIVESFAQANE